MIEEEKNRLEKQLEATFKKIGAEKAFGDPQIVEIVRKLNVRLLIIDSTDPCPVCEGTGGENHDCDCNFCDMEVEECEECDGSGRVDKF